jgi:hypothetical protein
MLTCLICHFETPLDDAVAPTASGRCVCLRCFMRETHTERTMPSSLQRELAAAAATADEGE